MSDSDFLPTREPNERVWHLTEAEQRTVLFGGEPHLLTKVIIRVYPNDPTEHLDLYALPIGRNGQPKRGAARLVWDVLDVSDSIHAVN